MRTLNVRANGQSLVSNFAAMDAGIARYVGYTWQSDTMSFVVKTDSESVPASTEYFNAVRSGDLVAADKATADYCGVAFKASDTADTKSKK